MIHARVIYRFGAAAYFKSKKKEIYRNRAKDRENDIRF